jgi:Ca2+/Na+ antiporter
MPPPADDMWFRPLACIWPFCFSIFAFISFGIWDIDNEDDRKPPLAFWIVQGCMIPICVLLYFVTNRDYAPKWSIVFSLFAFIGSILWLEFISNLVVDILGLISVMIGIDSAYLGITFLAWGNSVGDMVANYVVTKRGYAKMAIVGCFAGPFFNFCFGIGLSMIKEGIKAKHEG